jgi:hypothetical protein
MKQVLFVYPGPFFKLIVEWNLEDSRGKPITKVRKIGDDK